MKFNFIDGMNEAITKDLFFDAPKNKSFSLNLSQKQLSDMNPMASKTFSPVEIKKRISAFITLGTSITNSNYHYELTGNKKNIVSVLYSFSLRNEHTNNESTIWVHGSQNKTLIK